MLGSSIQRKKVKVACNVLQPERTSMLGNSHCICNTDVMTTIAGSLQILSPAMLAINPTGQPGLSGTQRRPAHLPAGPLPKRRCHGTHVPWALSAAQQAAAPAQAPSGQAAAAHHTTNSEMEDADIIFLHRHCRRRQRQVSADDWSPGRPEPFHTCRHSLQAWVWLP